MPEEQVRRRRRRRGGRGGRASAAAQDGEQGQERTRKERRPAPPAWEWRTFPVFFAFACGAFLILLVAPRPNTSLYSVLFFLFLGATAFGLAHIFTRVFIARRRR